MLFRGASLSAFLPQIEVSSVGSRESFGTSCSCVAAGSCHTGGFFRTGVLEGRKVRDLRLQYPCHVFLRQVLSLVLAAQEIGHLHHQRQR